MKEELMELIAKMETENIDNYEIRADRILALFSVVLPTNKEGTLVCDECNQKVKMITYTEVFPSCGCDEEN
jgi:hypothetical protein